MADPDIPSPVKLFIAILWRDESVLQATLDELYQKWGSCDYQGKDHPFDVSHYYELEMGKDLRRRIVAFEKLVSPEVLAEAKLFCNTVENKTRLDQRRQINLDIGYLDHNKVVLASAKGAGQKIYLTQGIYADLVARFGQGRYRPFEWTFLDFKDGRYDDELSQIRFRYLNQLKTEKQHVLHP